MSINEKAFEEICKKYNVSPKNSTADSDVNPIPRRFWHELISSYEAAKTEQPVMRQVSLNDITMEHCNKIRAQVGIQSATKEILQGHIYWKNYRECIKAALDIAGVKYVD